MKFVHNQIKIFLIESTSILKEQLTFLSQLVRTPIKYPPDTITHSFFSELYLNSLIKQDVIHSDINKKFINKLLLINQLPPDNFLIKQLHVLLSIQYHRIILILNLFLKKYKNADDKDEILNQLKLEFQKYIIKE